MYLLDSKIARNFLLTPIYCKVQVFDQAFVHSTYKIAYTY